MPAIDPARLEKQIDEVVAFILEPGEVAHRCLDLLDYYADRTRRVRATALDVSPSLGVPRPVLRSLADRLRSAVAQLPDGGLALAEQLWRGQFREIMILAAVVVGGRPGEPAARWLEAAASQCSDSEVLAHLASDGTEAWRRSDPQTFLTRAEVWLRSGDQRLVTFALLAFQAGVAEDPGLSLLAVLDILEGRLSHFRGPSRRAFVDLVRALVDRSPQEVARFLADEVRQAQGGPAVRSILKACLEAFPAYEREGLEKILST